MSAKTDAAAVTVATMRNGRMTAVRTFGHREVASILDHIGAVRASGGTTNVTISERVDGLGVSKADAAKITRAAR